MQHRNMLMKASTRGAYTLTCGHGCCDGAHGKNGRTYRRAIKRRERAAWRREIRSEVA